MIVALDANDDTANYVHIADAKDDKIYYCPCCKGIVKPRAFKTDKEYMVQAHYYHETGGCSDESFIHYICKTWLFEPGCEFKVNGNNYIVDSIETEKTLHTQFGDYRPDIIVHTQEEKTFFFEIKYTNRKTELYAPKWDELGNDVVEVDAREFINNKRDDVIPEFKLIYSDGECFIKSYSRTDYEDTIAKRKIEWKRQDKLNYKIQWERLDWFWNELQEYKRKNINKENVINAFNKMNYYDKVWCYLNIKGKSCVDLKESFKEDIYFSFCKEAENNIGLIHDKLKFKIYHVSPLIYDIDISIPIQFKTYTCKESISIRTRTKGGIIPSDFLAKINNCANKILSKYNRAVSRLKCIEQLEKIYYIKEIIPYSHWATNNYNFSDLDFNVTFQDYIFNKYVVQEIGEFRFKPYSISEDSIFKKYKEFRKNEIEDIDNMFIKHALKNNTKYMETLNKLKMECNNFGFELRVSNDYRRVWLLNNMTELCSYEFTKDDLFDEISDKIYFMFSEKIIKVNNMISIINNYISIINNCKNKLWKCERTSNSFNIILYLDDIARRTISFKVLFDYDYDEYVKWSLYCEMKRLIHGEYYNVRLMERK